MAVLTRIVALAALASIAFAEFNSPSAAESYEIAAQRARAKGHHERAVRLNSAGRPNRKRDAKKRCKSPSTSSTLATHKEAPTTSIAEPPAKEDKTPSTSSHHTSAKPTTSANPPPKETPNEDAAKSPAFNPSSKKIIGWSGTDKQLQAIVKQYPDLAGVYRWNPRPPAVDGLTGFSMLWGSKSVSDFKKYSNNYHVLMGANEPNLGSQADLSYQQAINQWNTYIRPQKKNGKYLISPAVTSAPSGLTFMKNFFAHCGKSDGYDHCGVNAVGLHIYSKTADGIISYVTKMHNELDNLPIALTEFGCHSFSVSPNSCTVGEAEDLMRKVTAWAEQTSWVELYGAYGWSTSLAHSDPGMALLDGSGKPNSRGKIFLNA